MTAGQGSRVQEGHGPGPAPNSVPALPPQGPFELAGPGVPQADRPVPTATGQGAAVRRESHGLDPTRMPAKGGPLLPGLHVPQADRVVARGAGQGLAVRRENHGLDLPRVAREGPPAVPSPPPTDRSCRPRRRRPGSCRPARRLPSGRIPHGPPTRPRAGRSRPPTTAPLHECRRPGSCHPPRTRRTGPSSCRDGTSGGHCGHRGSRSRRCWAPPPGRHWATRRSHPTERVHQGGPRPPLGKVRDVEPRARPSWTVMATSRRASPRDRIIGDRNLAGGVAGDSPRGT